MAARPHPRLVRPLPQEVAHPMSCPRCRAATKGHCPTTNPRCTWLRCTECKATINPARKRGYDAALRPFTWE